jgi:hypothetical protein
MPTKFESKRCKRATVKLKAEQTSGSTLQRKENENAEEQWRSGGGVEVGRSSGEKEQREASQREVAAPVASVQGRSRRAQLRATVGLWLLGKMGRRARNKPAEGSDQH